MPLDKLPNLLEKLQISTYDIARKLIREDPQCEDAEVIVNWLRSDKQYGLILITIFYIYVERKLSWSSTASRQIFKVFNNFFSIFRSVKGE